MDVIASLDAEVVLADLLAVLGDLDTYPTWLDIVARAVPDSPAATDVGPAWLVDLRGQIGPLRRLKRLRMVRTNFESDAHGGTVRFVRCELDGRTHSDWVMEATAGTSADSTTVGLTMRLHYGGSLWIPVLDRVLRDEIEKSRPRLVEATGRAAQRRS